MAVERECGLTREFPSKSGCNPAALRLLNLFLPACFPDQARAFPAQIRIGFPKGMGSFGAKK